MGFLLVGLNDANAGETSDRENTVTITKRTNDGGNAITMESDIKNERVRESKRGINSAVRNEEVKVPKGDAKVGLEVQQKVDAKVDSEV